jgi:hypothetical protein
MKDNTNVVGNVLDLKTAVCRELDVNELHRTIVRGAGQWAWCWGYTKAVQAVKDKALRFTVSGRHHKGWVYIVLNGRDLFDIYYTSKQNKIKKVENDIYIEDLIETLDISIERDPRVAALREVFK